MSEKDNIKLLLSSDKGKEVIDWLFCDYVRDIYIKLLDITIITWKTYPFISIAIGDHRLPNTLRQD